MVTLFLIIMVDQKLNNKVLVATKWSSITEIAAKAVAPITTMVLARLLTPDAFGVLVTAQMIISFAEIFTDAGFQKYIVQHEFLSEDDKFKSTAVAFWVNLFMSIIIWISISLFSSPIASLVGCNGHGLVIVVSCTCIPLTAFSSIQMALFRRNFDFKTLFWVRIIGILIPIFVTIPLAFATQSYWSLIVGMIFLNFSNAVILTLKSNWKPKWFFDFNRLKDMFSFSIWSMLEAVSIWLTSYVDIFIIGTMLSQYYLGLYRTSMSTVAQFTSIITAATTPVLFASLSRLQNSRLEFNAMFFKFQKIVSILVMPIGMGIYIFSDLITLVLLGKQWMQASSFIGMWALTSAITIVLAHYSSEVYRSIGKPKLSVLAQWLHIIVLWPILLIFIDKGFDTLCIARSLVRLELVVVQLILMAIVIKMNISRMFKNILPSTIASICMLSVLLLPDTESIGIKLVHCALCILMYIAVIMLFPEERHICLNLKSLILKK